MNITVVRNKNKHLKKKKTGQGELNFSEGKELMSSGLIYISIYIYIYIYIKALEKSLNLHLSIFFMFKPDRKVSNFVFSICTRKKLRNH